MTSIHSASFASHAVASFSPSSAATSAPPPPSCNMPVANDWRTSPWSDIAEIHAGGGGGGEWEKRVADFFEARLSSDAVVASLPSLNSTPVHELCDGQVVRFRCMIQDMFDPEFYVKTFSYRNLATGETRKATAKFRDIPPVGPRDEVIEDSVEHSERQSFYCVSVPAESPWATEEYRKADMASASTVAPVASGSELKRRMKRNHDDDKEESNADGLQGNGSADVEMEVEMAENGGSGTDGATDKKRAKTQIENGDVKASPSIGSGNTLNLPIANPKAKAAIVKVYGSDTDGSAFSLNDCCEFVGIVSLDPSLAAFPTDGTENDVVEQFGQQERLAKSPPPSLVPRIHAIKHKKLNHGNPLLPQVMELPVEGKETFLSEMRASREILKKMLTTVLLGDAVAAEYLICHLISKVYIRSADMLTLGKFTLNLHGLPAADNYSKRLATLVQLLTCKSHFLPMTVDNFNKMTFVPKKDFHANRLVSGLLQLPRHTHLVLDETAMSDGRLSPDGLKNLTALGNLINWQKVEYDFVYNRIEFTTDVPCLVLSEGRSMLPNDAQVMLKPSTEGNAAAEDISARFRSVGAELTAAVLDRLRKFITLSRHMQFSVTDEVQAAVERDFVASRQQQQEAGHQRMTAEDLHSMLVLSRLLSLSRAVGTMTEEVWQEVKELEREKRRRAAHLPQRARVNGPLAGAGLA